INDIVKYKRGECKELPARRGTEEEIYLRFDLDSIKEIDHIKPIQSGTQLVSYTTFYLLINAENMHELKLKSNLEIEVYKKLRSIAQKNSWAIRKEFNQYLINKNTVEILEGKTIRINGKITKLKDIKEALLI